MADKNIVGQTIKEIRLATTAELEREGWEEWHTIPVVIELDNGVTLMASRDPEGNGPGEMFFNDKDGEGFLMNVTETAAPLTEAQRKTLDMFGVAGQALLSQSGVTPHVTGVDGIGIGGS